MKKSIVRIFSRLVINGKKKIKELPEKYREFVIKDINELVKEEGIDYELPRE